MEVILQKTIKPVPDFLQLGWGQLFQFHLDLFHFAHGLNVGFAPRLFNLKRRRRVERSLGLRHLLSRVMETEIGEPIVVRFFAASAKAASWPMRMGMFFLSFIGLWALVSYVLRQWKIQGTSASM